MYETIGFLELNSIAKGIEAADAILKAAETELLFARAGCLLKGEFQTEGRFTDRGTVLLSCCAYSCFQNPFNNCLGNAGEAAELAN